MTCIHNQRCRYTHGFYCEDCSTFFDKDSVVYRSDELLSSIWMVLHNINAKRCRDGKDPDKNVSELADEIDLGNKFREDYEDLISKAEVLMEKHGVNEDSATVAIRE